MKICYTLLLIVGIGWAQDPGPLVTVTQGRVRGKLSRSRDGNVYSDFMGIPYGHVKERFQDSQPAVNWTGTFDATKPGSTCIQFDPFAGGVLGTEDCLFLNVHTPIVPGNDTETEITTRNETDLLPVLVFIHGGGFSMGKGTETSPKFLMDANVILVTFNYRLGAFGFLNAGTPSAKGNQGLKDQVLALKWVRENIRSFGGDPNRVTISGESAGGMSVSLLVLSPLAKGLFSSAISQSGTANSAWIYENFHPPLRNAKKLASDLDCPTSDVEYMVKCLKRIDPKNILLAGFTDFESMIFTTPETAPAVFGFTVDNSSTDPNGVFLPDFPSNLMERGEIASKVPYIIGVNSHEGFIAFMVLSSTELTRKLNEEWGRVAPRAFFYSDRAMDPCNVSSQVRSFYLDNKPISKYTVDNLTNLYGDSGFVISSRAAALAHSKVAPTYLYYFEKLGLVSLTDVMGNWTSRVAPLKYPVHFDELQYLYEIDWFPKFEDKELTQFSKNFVKLWASFVYDGKPSDPTGVEWDTVDSNSTNPKWFYINAINEMRDEEERISKAAEFWSQIGKNFKNMTTSPQ